MGAVGSMAWGRSGPGTLADASCQDHPETTGREDCVAGAQGCVLSLPPFPCPPGVVVTDCSPAPAPFSPTGPQGLEQQLRLFCFSAGSVVPDSF